MPTYENGDYGYLMMNRTVFGCRSNCGAQALARPSDRSTAPTRLIANIFQATDVIRRRRDSPLEAPRTIQAIPYADRFRPLRMLARDPADNQYTYTTLQV